MCKVRKMRYVTEREMRDIEVLKKLLEEGYIAITEMRFAVKEAESTDDFLIEDLIARLEEN